MFERVMPFNGYREVTDGKKGWQRTPKINSMDGE
jgi:hypothetical protein